MLLKTLGLAALCLTLSACNITGSAQKGPLKEGSTISASRLDSQGYPVSSSTINTQVGGTQGRFSVDRIRWSGWTGLVASGLYFDELSNSESTSALTLNAITRKDHRFDTANINLFTQLAAARIRQRISNGENRNNAWRNTQTEMKQLFNLTHVSRDYDRGVEQLSLVKGTGRFRADNANLLLFTGAFLASDGNQSNLLALTEDFADDGQFNGVAQSLFATIAIAANAPDLLNTLSQHLAANGASNPPNQQDLRQLPAWVNTDSGNLDTTAPEITITGENPAQLIVGDDYQDAGATASDDVDESVSVKTVNSTVDTNSAGNYKVTYSATDSAGNTATAVREVTVSPVADTVAPEITLKGENPVRLFVGDDYQEAGATASDNVDESVSVELVNTVDTNGVGNYKVTYSATDSAGNTATAVRQVIVSVIPDTTAPVITIKGATRVKLLVGDEYSDMGATATDTVDGTVAVKILSNNVTTEVAGSYNVVYGAKDAAGNSSEATRKVIVSPVPDKLAPEISIKGSNPVNLSLGDAYSDEGATALDNVDGSVTVKIISNDVNTNEAGTYTVVYSATDNAKNTTEATRKVVVSLVDNKAPEISIYGSNPLNLTIGDTYEEGYASATDDIDGRLMVKTVSNNVNTAKAGTYEVVYSATDEAGNTAQAIRKVIVSEASIELSSISVRITTPAGKALTGVSIVINPLDEDTSRVTSGSDGTATLELQADETYVLKLDLDGYATQVLGVKSPIAGEQISLDISMIKRADVQTFVAEDGATIVGDNGASVTIKANSFVDASNNLVKGVINVTVTPVDVSNSSSLATFPGSFAGIETDGSLTPIISLGVVEYKFTQNGKELQLMSEAVADILIPIYIPTYQNGTVIKVGESIPLWSLNETTGIWKQEGSGEVVVSADSPTGLAMRAQVEHFTWWNCDITMNTATANVTVNSPDVSSGSVTLIGIANKSCNIGWRSTTNNTITLGKTSSFDIPSSCEVCYKAEFSSSEDGIDSSNVQCEIAEPNGVVNINLTLATAAPLDILANDSAGPLNITAVLGFVSNRVQLRPNTLESSVSYSITSGSLPGGLIVSNKNGTQAEIVGVPTAVGDFTFEVTGVDATGTETDSVTINYSVYDPTSANAPPLFVNDIIYFDLSVLGNDQADAIKSYNLNDYNVGGASTNWSLEPDNTSGAGEAVPNWVELTSDGYLSLVDIPIYSGLWQGIVRATNSKGSTSTKISFCRYECYTTTPIPGDYSLSVRGDYSEEGGDAILKIYLNQVSPKDIIVNYITMDDTAIAGEDYVAQDSSVVIPAGDTSVDIPIKTIDNDVDGPYYKNFYVDISSPDVSKIEIGRAKIYIRDDDGVMQE